MTKNFSQKYVSLLASFFIFFSKETPNVFYYDALSYVWGAQSVLQNNDYREIYLYPLRGIYTAYVYLPAELLNSKLDLETLNTLIKLQNSVFLSIILTAFAIHIAKNNIQLILFTVIPAFALRNFAVYPLMDIWSFGLTLVSLIIIIYRKKFALLAGVALGTATVLRPSYLLILILLLFATIIRDKKKSFFVALGAASAYLPQIIFNFERNNFSYLPFEYRKVIQMQLNLSSFITRYDTVVYAEWISLNVYFCNPEMAALERGEIVDTSKLITFFLSHPFESLNYIYTKFVATALWSNAYPYFDPTKSLIDASVLFSLFLLGFGMIGYLYLVKKDFFSKFNYYIFFVLVGYATSIVLSAPETRFFIGLRYFLIIYFLLHAFRIFDSRGSSLKLLKYLVIYTLVGTLLAILSLLNFREFGKYSYPGINVTDVRLECINVHSN